MQHKRATVEFSKKILNIEQPKERNKEEKKCNLRGKMQKTKYENL